MAYQLFLLNFNFQIRNIKCLDTRRPGTVFKKLDTRQSEILTNLLEIARLIPLRTYDICLGISIDSTTETGRLFFRRRAKQLPLQRNIFELSPRDLSLTPQM